MSGLAFHTTRWSMVVRAAAGDPAVAQRALGELCELYWPALYAFVRRSGRSEADALDLVQSFCAQLLDRGGLGGADRQEGRFRHYLLGALRHFLDNSARHERAAKRGGSELHWSLDDAEARYAAEPPGAGPERLFERRWAMALLDRATARLRDEYEARGRRAVLDALEQALLGDDRAACHQDVARRLGTTEGAVKVALHRLRARLRELIRDEVLQTVTDPAAVDDELRALFAALAG